MDICKIRDNINIVRGNIDSALVRAGDSGRSVTLVAASKTMPYDIIDMVDKHQLLSVLGENRAQELRDKYRDNQTIEWHYIGAIQSSNIRIIMPRVTLIHGLDRLSIANEINSYCANHDLQANCLVQVNMGEEITKSGFLPDELERAVDDIVAKYNNINVRGIMAVMPIASKEDTVLLYRKLNSLHRRVMASHHELNILSAGMTNDYELAIEHAGSNMVRVGRAIFGDRQ